MRILITGAEGFGGSHLAELAHRYRAEIHGTALPGVSTTNLENVPQCRVHRIDLTDRASTEALIRDVRPQKIFHLAGISNPTFARKEPEVTLRVNMLSNLNILEACRLVARRTRILIVGSADEYGYHGQDKIREDCPLQPDNPYAYSKVCQDLTALAYYQQYGLHIVRVRPFNHIGPRQAQGFVATDFASQIAKIEAGLCEPTMEVGNLDVVRDFSDVRDIVAGYWTLLVDGKPGQVYNIGSGKGITVRTLLEHLLAMSAVKVKVRIRGEKIRKEKRFKIASITRITKDTGWRPRISLVQSLQAVLNDWRARK